MMAPPPRSDHSSSGGGEGGSWWKKNNFNKKRQLTASCILAAIGVWKLWSLTAPAAVNDKTALLKTAAGITHKTPPCHWTVLIGDSNIRELFYTWQEHEKQVSRQEANRELVVRQKMGTLPSKAPPIEEYSEDNEECYLIYPKKKNVTEYWYMDHEMIILVKDDNNTPNTQPPKCHIVTQKFVIYQTMAEKIHKRGWTNFTFCGLNYNETDLSSRGLVRPTHPDFVWFSHGFWNLPNGGRNEHLETLNCTARFQGTLQVLKEWQQQVQSQEERRQQRQALAHDTKLNHLSAKTTTRSNTRLVWQTLFPILHHDSITMDYIQWDYACQLQQAKIHGIAVVDLYKRLIRGPQEWLLYNDYHWNQAAKSSILSTLLTLDFLEEENHEKESYDNNNNDAYNSFGPKAFAMDGVIRNDNTTTDGDA